MVKIIEVALGVVKVLMVCGVVEYIAPGLSRELARELTTLIFKIARE